MSFTSSFVASLKHAFPTGDSTDHRRLPITKPILKMLVEHATKQQEDTMACVMATAWAGLFRMGELTATKRPFSHVLDISEADVDFVPTFWSAQCVIIREGPSKADRSGSKRRQNPRILPITTDPVCPGSMIRNMLTKRHDITQRKSPSPSFNKYTPFSRTTKEDS